MVAWSNSRGVQVAAVGTGSSTRANIEQGFAASEYRPSVLGESLRLQWEARRRALAGLAPTWGEDIITEALGL